MSKSMRKLFVTFMVAAALGVAGAATVFGGTAHADGETYTVKWEYYDGSSWGDLNTEEDLVYTPDSTPDNGIDNSDVSANVRAVLTGTGLPQKYAYIDGITDYRDPGVDGDTNVSTYKVKFTKAGSTDAVALKDAGEYIASLSGTGEEISDLGATASIMMRPCTLRSQDVTATLAVGTPDYTYDGEEKRPEINVSYGAIPLVCGTDYEIRYSDSTVVTDEDNHEHTVVVNNNKAILGGTATAWVEFMGNYASAGNDSVSVTFTIHPAENSWEGASAVTGWVYGAFVAQDMAITASAKYDFGNSLHASVVDNLRQEITVDGVQLNDIALNIASDDSRGDRYVVADSDVAAALNKLDAGVYSMKLWMDETASYTGLEPSYVEFTVFKTNNYWESIPYVVPWEVGKYSSEKNDPIAVSHFGTPVVKVTKGDGQIVYNSGDETNTLAELAAGEYTVTATVEGSGNYNPLSATFKLIVFEPDINDISVDEGMPWWGIMFIVIGVLAAAAAVLVVLHMTGVLQMFTGRGVMAMRQKADNDALIAAVRANRANAEAEEQKNKKQDGSDEQPADEEKAAEAPAEEPEKTAEEPEKAAEQEGVQETGEPVITEKAEDAQPEQDEKPQKPAPKKTGGAKKSGSKSKKPKTEE